METEQIPERLFHFTRCDTALTKILRSGQIKISSLGETNDPRETKEWGFPVFWESSVMNDKVFPEKNKIHDTANQIRRKEWFVLALSRNDNDLKEIDHSHLDLQYFKFGYARSRLWAHYADHHKGVCLEFNGPQLDSAIRNVVGKEAKVLHGNVSYRDEFDPVEGHSHNAYQFDYDAIVQPNLQDGLRRHILDYYKEYFLEKHNDWRTENEYRWLVNSENSGPFYAEIKDCLRAVLLGVDFPLDRIDSATEQCKRLGVSLGKMSWANRVPVADFGSVYSPS